MTKLTGTIESIEYRNISGHEKKVVTLKTGNNQRAFIEFRSRHMEKIDSFKENDEIEVDIIFEGKISKNSGIQYNNLIACTIKPA